MQLDIIKTLKLDYLGTGWEDCYLSFRPISVKEARQIQKFSNDNEKLAEMGLDLLSEKFVEGKVLSGGKVVPMDKKNLEDLPVELLSKSILMLNTIDEEKKIA